ncbi:RepB family plasmid replication initiator protein [Escherichia coli]|uniref:RepB family plasmid replication initiator protein n=1 Tax=Escherichia coli TaxID=562 RepID=UPI000A783EED|nr:RepB family plasmid replication initiator protein [Escherichia coli]
MSSNNKKLSLVIEEVQKRFRGSNQTFPTLRQTIQPKILLRLRVFVPTLKSTDKGGRKNHRIDATEPLSRLSIVEGEGYSQIQIYGPRLDMDSDFKSWCGIVYALSSRPLDSEGQLVLNFPEFAKFCGLTPSALINNLESVLMPH